MKNIEGVITALVTPFKNAEVDFGSLKKLLKNQLDQGIDGLVIHGTTGESPVTTDLEKEKIFSFVKSEVGGQIPLIVGTGSNSTAETIVKSKKAEQWGADAILTVVPYYNKPPQRGLFQHFNSIANAVEIPTILYNVPSRTVATLELDTIVALSENKKIIGIKEATGNIEFGAAIIKKCHKDFCVLSGDDKTFLGLSAKGGRGIIAVASHIIGKQMKELYIKNKAGNLSEKDCQSDYQKYFSLIDSLYLEANPIPVKYALKKLGIIESAEMRLPLVELKDEFKKEVDENLRTAL